MYHATTQIVMYQTGEVLAVPGPVDDAAARRILDFLGWCSDEEFHAYQFALMREGDCSPVLPRPTYESEPA